MYIVRLPLHSPLLPINAAIYHAMLRRAKSILYYNEMRAVDYGRTVALYKVFYFYQYQCYNLPGKHVGRECVLLRPNLIGYQRSTRKRSACCTA